MNDIVTIVRKELKEHWHARGSPRSRILSYLPILLIFGVVMPLQDPESWTETPVAGIMIMMLPFILAGGTVADSFAGERERRTLETLLATRLSDRDIYLGKVLATVIYSVGLAWICALLSWGTLNVSRGDGPVFMYSSPMLAMIGVGALLMGLLTAAAGVLVSLRAATVRSAAQVFGMITLALFVGGPLLLKLLPESGKAWIERTLVGIDVTAVGIAAALIVLVIDVALLAIGIARFQRKKLILE